MISCLQKSKLFILYMVYCFTVIPALAEGKNNDEIHELLKKEKIELDKLKVIIKKQSRDLSRMGKKKQSILKKQRILDDQLKSKERELKIYNWNLTINKNKIKNLTVDIQKNKKRLDSHRSSMMKRLRSIYKEGSMYPVKILFSSDDFVDLLNRVKYMEKLAVYDAELFNNYDHQINVLSRKKESLLTAKNKLHLYKEAAQIKKKEISTEKIKKKTFLARLNKEKKVKEILKVELIQSSQKLNQLISRLEKKQILGKGLDISDKKGRLLPPVKGKFLNKFGRIKDKKYDTYIVYNGINILSPKGASVRAVFEGKNSLHWYTGKLR